MFVVPKRLLFIFPEGYVLKSPERAILFFFITTKNPKPELDHLMNIPAIT